MENVIDIFVIILLISASALCVFLIFSLKKIITSIEGIQTDLHSLSQQTGPLLESVIDVSNKISVVSDSVEEQLSVSRHIIYSIKERVDSLLSLEKKIQDEFETPIVELIKNVTAIRKGIQSFWKSYTNQ